MKRFPCKRKKNDDRFKHPSSTDHMHHKPKEQRNCPQEIPSDEELPYQMYLENPQHHIICLRNAHSHYAFSEREGFSLQKWSPEKSSTPLMLRPKCVKAIPKAVTPDYANAMCYESTGRNKRCKNQISHYPSLNNLNNQMQNKLVAYEQSGYFSNPCGTQAGMNFYNSRKLYQGDRQFFEAENLNSFHPHSVEWHRQNTQITNDFQTNQTVVLNSHSQTKYDASVKFCNNINYLTPSVPMSNTIMLPTGFTQQDNPVVSQIPLAVKSEPLTEHLEVRTIGNETNIPNFYTQNQYFNTIVSEDYEKTVIAPNDNLFSESFNSNLYSNLKPERQISDPLKTQTTLPDYCDNMKEIQMNTLTNYTSLEEIPSSYTVTDDEKSKTNCGSIENSSCHNSKNLSEYLKKDGKESIPNKSISPELKTKEVNFVHEGLLSYSNKAVKAAELLNYDPLKTQGILPDYCETDNVNEIQMNPLTNTTSLEEMSLSYAVTDDEKSKMNCGSIENSNCPDSKNLSEELKKDGKESTPNKLISSELKTKEFMQEGLLPDSNEVVKAAELSFDCISSDLKANEFDFRDWGISEEDFSSYLLDPPLISTTPLESDVYKQDIFIRSLNEKVNDEIEKQVYEVKHLKDDYNHLTPDDPGSGNISRTLDKIFEEPADRLAYYKNDDKSSKEAGKNNKLNNEFEQKFLKEEINFLPSENMVNKNMIIKSDQISHKSHQDASVQTSSKDFCNNCVNSCQKLSKDYLDASTETLTRDYNIDQDAQVQCDSTNKSFRNCTHKLIKGLEHFELLKRTLLRKAIQIIIKDAKASEEANKYKNAILNCQTRKLEAANRNIRTFNTPKICSVGDASEKRNFRRNLFSGNTKKSKPTLESHGKASRDSQSRIIENDLTFSDAKDNTELKIKAPKNKNLKRQMASENEEHLISDSKKSCIRRTHLENINKEEASSVSSNTTARENADFRANFASDYAKKDKEIEKTHKIISDSANCKVIMHKFELGHKSNIAISETKTEETPKSKEFKNPKDEEKCISDKVRESFCAYKTPHKRIPKSKPKSNEKTLRRSLRLKRKYQIITDGNTSI